MTVMVWVCGTGRHDTGAVAESLHPTYRLQRERERGERDAERERGEEEERVCVL